MRITFVQADANFSGGNRATAIHAENLRRMGHQVAVVTAPAAKFSARTLPRLTARALRASLRKRNLEPLASLYTPVATTSHLDNTQVDHRVLSARPPTDKDIPDADVVIATWWETAEWVHHLSPQKGRKFHFVQGKETVLYDDVRDHAAVLNAWTLPLQKLAVSSWLVSEIAVVAPHEKVTLVYNGVDVEQFRAPPRTANERRTFGFIHYGAIKEKGSHTIVRACENLQKQDPTLRFRAFGLHPRSEIALPAFVEYEQKPPQSSIAERYASFDFFLHCPRVDGFGLPLLEAMACRTPVISSRAGAAQDLVFPGGAGVNGYLLESAEASDLTAAMQRAAMLSASDWLRLSENAHALAQTHSWVVASRVFEEALLASSRST